MPTLIEHTDEFEAWWSLLSDDEKESLTASVLLLEEHGPSLRHPHSSGINGSRHGHMRELRVQHKGRPYRVFYCFNPLRNAILLIGGDKTGDKTGDNRFYEKMIPIADDLYDVHLKELHEEGLLK